MKYIVYDTTGHPVGVPFSKYEDAATYKCIYGRQDWTIKRIDTRRLNGKKSTDRQKAAVRFCEQWLYCKFEGDINNFYEVSDFLSDYLELAKDQYEEARCEYEAYLWDLD